MAAHCSLQAKRLLLDPKFEGYKLSLEPLACYQLELDAGEEWGGAARCGGAGEPTGLPFALWPGGSSCGAPLSDPGALVAGVPRAGDSPARCAGRPARLSGVGTAGSWYTWHFLLVALVTIDCSVVFGVPVSDWSQTGVPSLHYNGLPL